MAIRGEVFVKLPSGHSAQDDPFQFIGTDDDPVETPNGRQLVVTYKGGPDAQQDGGNYLLTSVEHSASEVTDGSSNTIMLSENFLHSSDNDLFLL